MNSAIQRITGKCERKGKSGQQRGLAVDFRGKIIVVVTAASCA
jgi:hypothetical protein